MLILLLTNQTVFNSDSKSSSSGSSSFSDSESDIYYTVFSKKIKRSNVYPLRSDADIAPDFFKAFESFSADSFNKNVKNKIIESDPTLRSAQHKSGEDFKVALVQRAIEKAIDSSMVYLEGLDFRSYRTTKNHASYKIAKDDYEGPMVDIWRDLGTGAYYKPDDFVGDDQLYYDKTKIIESLNHSVGVVEEALARKDPLCTGQSRHILSPCPVKHAFHLGCIKNSLERSGLKCPLCLISVTKKSIKFDPNYKEGEDCGVCFNEIKPSPVVAPASSLFYSSTASFDGCAGAGCATTTPAVSPVRLSGRGVKTRADFNREESASSSPKKHKGNGGSGFDRDDSEPLS